jgi:hypothetical protein
VRRLAWLSLLTLVLGFGLGLLYSWVISPLRYADTLPNTLRPDFKDAFRTAIASAYAATGNLERARTRLALLGDVDPIQALTAQAQRMLAAGEPFQSVQDVAMLASDLRAGAASVLPSATSSPIPATAAATTSPTPTPSPLTPTQVTSEPSGTDTAPAATALFDTPTPRPTHTPIPTASAPFQLVSQDQVCNPNLTSGLMQISVLDSDHHQMPGVEIDISWPGGEESFFTGLKPEIADGYADYVMQPGMMYSLRVERSGTPVSGLSAPSCPDANAQSYLGGLKLVFQQP